MSTCANCQSQFEGLPVRCPSCGAEVPLWIRRGEEIYGPYRLADLYQAQAQGRLSAQDQVSAGDEGEWQPLQALFNAEIAASPTPPPPPTALPATAPRPAARGQRKPTLLVVLIVVGFGLFFILPILAAIIFPVFAKGREKAQQAACMSNLKMLSIGMLAYGADNDERFPNVYGMREFGVRQAIPKQPALDIQRDFPPGNWRRSVFPYVKNAEVFVCPGNRYPYSFDYDLYGKALEGYPQPDLVATVYDTGWLHQYLPPPHNDGYNVAYADGHVRWRSRGERPRQPIR